jgi:hypothetical protein
MGDTPSQVMHNTLWTVSTSPFKTCFMIWLFGVTVLLILGRE